MSLGWFINSFSLDFDANLPNLGWSIANARRPSPCPSTTDCSCKLRGPSAGGSNLLVVLGCPCPQRVHGLTAKSMGHHGSNGRIPCHSICKWIMSLLLAKTLVPWEHQIRTPWYLRIWKWMKMDESMRKQHVATSLWLSTVLYNYPKVDRMSLNDPIA